jgi:ATP synthase protein I
MSNGAEGPPSNPADAADRGESKRAARRAEDDMWAASGLLMAGVFVWGGAGYLVAQWLDEPLFTMVGLLVGTATALYGIWFRYGRS